MERRKEHPPLTSRSDSKSSAIAGISAKPVNPDDGLPLQSAIRLRKLPIAAAPVSSRQMPPPETASPKGRHT